MENLENKTTLPESFIYKEVEYFREIVSSEAGTEISYSSGKNACPEFWGSGDTLEDAEISIRFDVGSKTLTKVMI